MPTHSSDRAGGQADGLRRSLASAAPVRVIAVASGKGGVGKTNVSVNLGIALAERGREVMLLDADLGLGNADVLLGVQPRRNLSHVLDGECSLEEILIEGPAGLRLVPAASGVRRMMALAPVAHAGIVNAFGSLSRTPDVLLIDSAAGLADTVISFAAAAQEVLVVVCDEPASLTDAYALIKVLNRECGRTRFRVLANMVRSDSESRGLYEKLLRVSDRFLDVSLEYVGAIPFDEHVHKAVRRQRAVVDAYPRCRAAEAFRLLAQQVDGWSWPQAASGGLEFFVERLIQAASAAEVARS